MPVALSKSLDTEARSARAGDVIAGKFRVERALGEGGMGFVVEATHLMLDERVALKFLHREVLVQPDVVARFLQEARAAAKLKSEHVARVLDVGVDEGVPYIVMECLEGRNLEDVLSARGPLPVHEAVELIVQAAEGISEAHARGIIHRDLKPANLFLAERADGWPTLKILDFGISKAALTSSSGLPMELSKQIKTLQLLGTPYYMSPEQIRSTKDVDRRTDLWALGTVLFELVTGETAFSSTELLPLAHEITERPHRRVSQLRPDVPAGFEALIDRALAKDPANRFQSAGELAVALLAFTTSKRSRVIATHAVTLTRSSGIDRDLPLPSSAPSALSSSGSPIAIPASGSLPRIDSHPSLPTAPTLRPPLHSGITRVDSSSGPTMNSTPVAMAAATPPEKTRTPIFAIAIAGIALVGIGMTISFLMHRPASAATTASATAIETATANATAVATATAIATAAATATATAATATATATATRLADDEAKAAAEPAATAKPQAHVVVRHTPPAGGTATPTAAATVAPPRDLDIRLER